MANLYKTILVTGAAKRLGRAIALDFAARGWQILLHYRSSEAEAIATKEECLSLGARHVELLQADLTQSNERQVLLGDVKKLGILRMDAVVLPAAVFRKTDLGNVVEGDFDFHYNANVKANFFVIQGLLKFCTIDNIVLFGDWSATRPYAGYLPYCMSKAAVLCMTKALALELAPKTRVNCISPGTVLPPDGASPEKIYGIEQASPLKRIGSPDDIVAGVRFLVEENQFSTGSEIVIDGGRMIQNSDLY